MKKITGKYASATIYTKDIEEQALAQVQNMLDHEITEKNQVAIMPDVHAGKGSTIGTTIQLSGEKESWKISPNVVGVDVGCGIMMYQLADKAIDLKELDRVINKKIPAGFAVHPRSYHEKETRSEIVNQLNLRLDKKTERRLLDSRGTLGGGNHYIELAVDESGNYWLSVHSGSRHLGVKVASYYQKLAKNHRKILIEEKNTEGLKDANLAYLSQADLAHYLHDMTLAQKYAHWNRQTMLGIIVEEMNFQVIDTFDSIHNYIDIENGIIRKGATSAQKEERLVIPLNMRDGSLICRGKGNPEWNYSAPHGAGRVMSRTTARKELSLALYQEQMKDVYSSSIGQRTLDEAPDAYKAVDSIIENISETVTILHHLKPVYNFKSH